MGDWAKKKVLLTAFSPAEFSESKVLYAYLKDQGCQDISAIFWGGEAVKSGIPEDVKSIEVKDWHDIKDVQMDSYDVVFRHTSVPPAYLKDAQAVMSSTQLFFDACPAPIIGVTGTKGKGTTCSLIAKILSAAGRNVHLVGNIGVPALEVLPNVQPDDLVVFELSSFQLWDLEKSPQSAVVLMIEPDHMDVHSSMEEYVAAKSNIAAHQDEDDLIVYHPTNKYSAEIAQSSPAQKKKYMTSEGAYIIGGQIVIDNVAVCKVEEVGLVGQHNLENICAALTAVWEYEQNVTAVQSAIKDFKGLPHRLEFVREVKGIRYYDDSQATGVGSCLAALRSFDEPTALIFGGSDKGVDMSDVVAELDVDRHHIVLIGQSSDTLEGLLKKRNFSNYTNLGQKTTMEEIVDKATKSLPGGGVILLSPAHASFDMFKSYEDRGNQFKAAVQAL